MNINATILGQAISFFIFVWFCMKYVWPPILNIIEKRQKDIIDSLDFVKKEREKLAIDKEMIQKEINNKKEEAVKIINLAYKQRDIILEKSKKNAELVSKNIFLKSKVEIIKEQHKVKEELYQYVAKLAIKMAEKVMKQSISKNNNNDTINQLILNLSEQDKLSDVQTFQ
ncbi:F0F1 ATP synthase subunit B [Buchnera aphidicola (Formosaphis micheliae)]|uniref:F0F1 ATP synthase subunit B n=1 Tax=Buchnera aphidicola TaxID=9 RepID=UPI0031CCD067